MAGFDVNSDLINCGSTSSSLGLAGIKYKFVSEVDYVEPVTPEEFKVFAGIDFATDDLMVADILKASRIAAERYLKKSLGVRTVRFTARECYPDYHLDWGPVASVTSYGFSIFSDRLVEGGRNITVDFITDASLVSDDTKYAIMMLAMDAYDNRDRFLSRYRETGELFDKFKEKLAPYRKRRVV
jgi:hypothetical protein